MAGTQITTAITQVDEQRKGFQNITLTNWTNVAEPEINQGGRVEIEGALFSFTANEDLDASNNWAGFGNSTQIYGYYLVGGGGASVTCELTTTAPTWQEEKGGWYDTASDTNRFWGGIFKDVGGNYADKFLYVDRTSKTTPNNLIDNRGNLDLTGYVNDDKQIDFASDATILWDESENEFYFNKSLKVAGGIETDGTKLKTKKVNIGAWNMDTTTGVNVAHGLTFGNIIAWFVTIRDDTDAVRTPLNQANTGGGLPPSGKATLGAVNIALARTDVGDGGIYDNTAYDIMGDDGNRGFITIIYIA